MYYSVLVSVLVRLASPLRPFTGTHRWHARTTGTTNTTRATAALTTLLTRTRLLYYALLY